MATGTLTGDIESASSETACSEGSQSIGRSPLLRRAASESNPVEELLGRMRNGDREAAAAFITRYGSRLRRRVRGKLGPAMRRLFDSQEIMSTVSRRLDLYVREGRLQAAGERQLWALVLKIADNALIDKIRVFEHLQNVEGSDGAFAQEMLRQMKRSEKAAATHGGAEIEIEHAMRALPDRTDRQILSMWLMGRQHTQIARELDMASTGVRKRWQSIKQRLRTHFGG
jgi:DNA-directed RNA polymerase specialized sigma24 family protein